MYMSGCLHAMFKDGDVEGDTIQFCQVGLLICSEQACHTSHLEPCCWYCRLPYAVVTKDDVPKKIATAVKQLTLQRGHSLAPQQPASKQLHGVLNNMINPGMLDSYIRPDPRIRPKPAGADVLDFRRCYVANKGGGGANDSASYDARNSPPRLHERRLLLSAECQIGKTGAYLALLLKLKQLLKPQVAVLLPVVPTEADETPGPAEADEIQGSEPKGALVEVDVRR